METNTLQDLLIHELKDVFSAESQITKALPKISKAASSDELRAAIDQHLEETREQARRIEQILKAMGETTKGPACEGMKGLLEEGSKIIEEVPKGPVRDAGIIGACQKVEHYEIAAYGTMIRFAELLGLDDHAAMLQQTLDEERKTDDGLSAIAEGSVNAEAAGEENSTKSSKGSRFAGGSTGKTATGSTKSSQKEKATKTPATAGKRK